MHCGRVKVDTCCFMIQTCINTYIKYVTEKFHKKIVNYVKSTLDSIVGAEKFTGP